MTETFYTKLQELGFNMVGMDHWWQLKGFTIIKGLYLPLNYHTYNNQRNILKLVIL